MELSVAGLKLFPELKRIRLGDCLIYIYIYIFHISFSVRFTFFRALRDLAKIFEILDIFLRQVRILSRANAVENPPMGFIDFSNISHRMHMQRKVFYCINGRTLCC